MTLSVFTAFLAGLVSFLSPCVLPLVPGYIALISGISIEKLKEKPEGSGRAVLLPSLLFVLGFSAVFIAFGASASSVGSFLLAHKTLLYKVAGAIIVLFGIFLLGWIRIPALYREKRFQGARRGGRTGSFLLGLAFAFGWTPCIGPVLGAMLALAATRETVAEGTFLLAVYSAGLGVPFLLTALGISRFLALYQSFRRHLQWVERVAGVLLVGVGVLVFFNKLTLLSSYLSFLNRFAW